MNFESKRPFIDHKTFPRGIHRSGEFTINEAKILEAHGVAMQEISWETTARRCRGKSVPRAS